MRAVCTPPGTGAAVLGSRLTAANGRVPVRVKCRMATDCAGRLTLRTRGAGTAAKKSRVVGTRKVRIGAGKTARVRVPLNRLGRRLAKRKRTKLAVTVDLGSRGTAKKNMVLRRR